MKARPNLRGRVVPGLVAACALVLCVASGGSPIGAAEPQGAAPPPGLLTRFEQLRHGQFVRTPRPGVVDLVFIGDSAVEFWLQDGEGKAVWDRSFRPRGAVNLGVQGASVHSMLWRVRNGELDGFEAKVVVIDGMWTGARNKGASEAEIVRGNAMLVEEVLSRQPTAKVLLTVVPRTRHPDSPNRPIETALARALARLADGERVHFVDVGPAFLRPDGTLDTMKLSGRGNAMNGRGYDAWARAIAPKIAELTGEG